jgi:hypothetical protein
MHGLEFMARVFELGFFDAMGPLIILIVFVVLVILWYVREGRNPVLEQMLTLKNFGPPEAFRGNLIVEEHRPSAYLRLGKSTRESRWLHFKYRWLMGQGRQAVFNEVTFDRSTGIIDLQKNDSRQTLPFSAFVAIRMRETAASRSHVSVWHIDLIPQNGRVIPIVTSVHGYREAVFEHTAPLLKAISAITGLPMQAYVAGNVWTPGWPPKVPSISA